MLGWVARDGKIILLEKAVRTIPYGFMSVVFPVYLAQLGFNPLLVGLILTLTTVTSAFYTFIASLVADRIGRRKTLVFFALTDSIAGSLLFLVAAPWGPVAAGVVGNMSVGAGEVGPYLSLEQAILPGVIDSKRRTWGFSVYNLIGYGAFASGALIIGLPQFNGSGLSTFRPLVHCRRRLGRPSSGWPLSSVSTRSEAASSDQASSHTTSIIDTSFN